MVSEVIFLTSIIPPNEKEDEAIDEYIHYSMSIDDIEQLNEDINIIESDINIDPYNYEITKKELYYSLKVLNIVNGYKNRALKNHFCKAIFKSYTENR